MVRAGFLGAMAMAAALSGCSMSPLDVLGRGPGDTPAATSAPPPPPSAERLVSAIESNGCALTGSNVDAILVAAQMTAADLRDVVPVLDAEGRVVVVGEEIRVISETCI